MEKEAPFECCSKCGKDCSEIKSLVIYGVLAENLEEDIVHEAIARLCEPCAMGLSDWLFERWMDE